MYCACHTLTLHKIKWLFLKIACLRRKKFMNIEDFMKLYFLHNLKLLPLNLLFLYENSLIINLT